MEFCHEDLLFNEIHSTSKFLDYRVTFASSENCSVQGTPVHSLPNQKDNYSSYCTFDISTLLAHAADWPMVNYLDSQYTQLFFSLMLQNIMILLICSSHWCNASHLCMEHFFNTSIFTICDCSKAIVDDQSIKLYIYVYIYIYICECVCVCVYP